MLYVDEFAACLSGHLNVTLNKPTLTALLFQKKYKHNATQDQYTIV
jgi:hypothetical protein